MSFSMYTLIATVVALLVCGALVLFAHLDRELERESLGLYVCTGLALGVAWPFTLVVLLLLLTRLGMLATFARRRA